MKGTYTRELVNEAIFTVLTEQFKKDAKEAHLIVEQAGYIISKMDGDWYIKNSETGRRIYMHVARRTYGMSYLSLVATVTIMAGAVVGESKLPRSLILWVIWRSL